MALIFIVGSGAVATTAGRLLSDMGHSVTFVEFSASAVNVLRAKGYEACLANDINSEPGSFIFLASEDKPGRELHDNVMDELTASDACIPCACEAVEAVCRDAQGDRCQEPGSGRFLTQSAQRPVEPRGLAC